MEFKFVAGLLAQCVQHMRIRYLTNYVEIIALNKALGLLHNVSRTHTALRGLTKVLHHNIPNSKINKSVESAPSVLGHLFYQFKVVNFYTIPKTGHPLLLLLPLGKGQSFINGLKSLTLVRLSIFVNVHFPAVLLMTVHDTGSATHTH